MTYDEIFEAFYTLYRAESELPGTEDDEYIVGRRLANEAVKRWANYDNTMWKNLYSTLQLSGDGDSILVASTTTYDAPEDMRMPGGPVRVLDADNRVIQTYPIIDPQEVQFQGDQSKYAYFTGAPGVGYTLTINPAPTTNLVGKSFDYMYYRLPTLYEDGDSISDVPNPYFVVNRVLAQRFRASRNWSAYQTAMRDAEDALKAMKMENDSGSWGNPWTMPDRSGTNWGG